MERRRDLEQRLAAHAPADERERRHVARVRGLLADARDPFDKHRFHPGHVTASGFVLSPDGASLLMVLHGKLGRWLQPGGHVDAGDPDVLAAARREVREELGLVDLPLAGRGVAPFDVDVHPIPAREPFPAHEHFDVRFLFRAASRGFRVGSDARDARWMPVAELSRRAPDASLRRVLAKLG